MVSFGGFLSHLHDYPVGEWRIILITRVDTTLQTPMYFFLGNFSFLEICYVSVTLPRMLVDLWTQTGTISFFTCALRMCSFPVLGATECCLLAVTACDQRVAVCASPGRAPPGLRRAAGRRLDQRRSGPNRPDMPDFSPPFCGSNTSSHFFSDIPPSLKLTPLCRHLC